MDKDYTQDYPQEDVLRGLEETVQTVESTFHVGYVWMTDSIVCMTHCTCFVSVCTVNCT
jgi:hypothetical protein